MSVLAKDIVKNCNATAINKIPDYARDYRNENLFVRGINKDCKKFVVYLYEIKKNYLKVQKLTKL